VAADIKANYVLFGLVRVAAATISTIPGNPGVPLGPFVGFVHYLSAAIVTPLPLLAAAAGLVALCLTGNWKLSQPGEPPGTVSGAPRGPRRSGEPRGSRGRHADAAGYGLTPQSAAVGRRIGPAPMACNTIVVTTGLVGNWSWLIRSLGQTDWMGTLIAPASRADPGGVTT
jgi:hypothetical protein